MKQFRRRRRIQQDFQESDSGQMMNLSLFVMLLAFFIVLNSMTSYEEIKTELVKRSLSMAFSKDPNVEILEASPVPDPVKNMREGHTFDRIDALFEAQISSYDKVISKSRGVMMVELPYEEFERAIMAIGQKNLLNYPTRQEIRGNFFLPTLASILRTNIDGAPTRMEILIQRRDNPAYIENQTPQEMLKIISTVGQFAQRLEKQGMSQKLINIGVKKGDPKMINLVFRKYIPFSPVGENPVKEETPDE